MGWGLGKAKWHPQPPELTPMADECRKVAGLLLHDDVVESCLQVYEANVLGSAEVGSVSSDVVQLVLVLLGSLVDGDDVVAHPIGLATLGLGN